MFGLFKKKTEQEQLYDFIKSINKTISKSGGAFTVCVEFLEFIGKNAFYKETGLIIEEEAPNKSVVISAASLHLLLAWRNGIDSKEDAEMTFNISKLCFESSQKIMGEEDLKKFFLMSLSEALNYLNEKNQNIATAWEGWVTQDIETLHKLVSA